MADLTVYYDASCPMCRAEIAFYRTRTPADFVDVSNAANVPADLTAEEAMALFHVRDEGTLLRGASAFAALWRKTPGLTFVGRVAGLPGVRHVLGALYRVFLVVRPFIQRRIAGKACSDQCR